MPILLLVVGAVVVVGVIALAGGVGPQLYRGFQLTVTNIAIEGGSAWTWRAVCADGCHASFAGGPEPTQEAAAVAAQRQVDAFLDGVGGKPYA